MRRLLKIIDKWDGADKPVHPLVLEGKKNKYIGYLVLCLLFPVLFIGVGVSGIFYYSPVNPDDGVGIIEVGLIWALGGVLGFAFKWRQLKRIPVDVEATPPDDFRTEIRKAMKPDKSVLPGIVVTAIVVFALSFSPTGPKEAAEHQEKEEGAKVYFDAYLQTALRPQHEIRVKPDGGDMKVYVSKSDFESIPFPDREEFMTAAGKAWCEKNPEGFLPSMSIYDIRSGEKLGAYSCTFAWVSLP